MPCATVSIDIDGIGCYHAIHGLSAPTGVDPMYAVAMPRFLELVAGLRLKATLFAVGRDAETAAAAQLLRRASDDGHEVANHSYRHDYRLIRQPAIEIESDLAAAHRAIEQATGIAPRGFRAPGYNVSDALLDALE
ncbi:MAG: polysaccharide deacetylase family protein, partial [Deltaproteobacteria bacterium]|nr:polysaccharide deacetylase family protein [Deltaproteobacteria bacterium]